MFGWGGQRDATGQVFRVRKLSFFKSASDHPAKTRHTHSDIARKQSKSRPDRAIHPHIPQFGTLQVTLDMTKESMEKHSNHRAALFKFLYFVVRHNFAVFECMNSAQMLVINCILWAHEHIDHAICELGSRTLSEFLDHIRAITANTRSGAMFYRNFLVLILEKLLGGRHVMTDTSTHSRCWARSLTIESN